MLRGKNFLLNRLEPSVVAPIEPYLPLLELTSKMFSPRPIRIEKVYFPHSSIIYCVL